MSLLKACCCALFAVFFVSLPFSGKSQSSLPFFTPHLNGGVQRGPRTLSAPFAGGTRAAQFAMADLNRDGKADLVLFNSAFGALKIRTFLNGGTAGSPKWVYAPQFALSFPPDVTGYLKLLDYNCDGIPDLFHHGAVGVSVSRGYYNASNELRFAPYKELYTPGQQSVYVGNLDEPGIADVDGDGDLDVVAYSIFGSFMYYYRNYSVERGLPCDSMQMEVESGCWGRAGQGIFRELVTGLYGNCSTQPLWEGGPTGYNGAAAAKTTAHGYNSVCLLDADGDGDLDILNGNAVFADLQYQQNSRVGSANGALDSISAQDTTWQKGGKKVLLPAYPTAYFLDIDGDGKRDIVVAPREESDVAHDKNGIWYYRNEGTATTPNFVFQKDSLLVEDMIDGGSDSHPLFYDFDKDGKPDILMGSTMLTPNGSRQNQLSYYQNITTDTGAPQYRFITNNGANVAALPTLGCVPAVGDLDGDGKDDLLIGLQNGQFAFYKNSAVATAAPVWTLSQALLKNPTGAPLSVGAYAAPFIYDINGDGQPDILSGSQGGRLTAFINGNAAQGTPFFNVRKDSLGGTDVLVDPTYSLNRYSAPYVGRLDSSQAVYLVMGSNSGTVKVWSGIDPGNLNATYTLAATDFSQLRVPARCAPAFGDGDGDGRPEMLIGSSWGGLFMYASYGTVAGIENLFVREEAPVILFPNPALTDFTVRRTATSNGALHLSLCNLLGQVVAQESLPAGKNETTISTAHLPAGTYLLRVQSSSSFSALKVTVSR